MGTSESAPTPALLWVCAGLSARSCRGAYDVLKGSDLQFRVVEVPPENVAFELPRLVHRDTAFAGLSAISTYVSARAGEHQAG